MLLLPNVSLIIDFHHVVGVMHDIDISFPSVCRMLVLCQNGSTYHQI